jgi:acyl-CoA thioesterase
VSREDVDLQALAERSAQALYAPDRASQALGMRIVAVAPQAASVTMAVRPEMCNGHGICHGGLIFALADSAFAFACNSGGEQTLAASCNIDFLEAAHEGDELTAAVRGLWRGGRSGIYEGVVTNQHGARIALFRGRSHRIGERRARGTSHGTQDEP